MIFRDQGSRVPTGIGEFQTVVTAPETEITGQDTDAPRSGDVDISDQATTLTPEKPAEEPIEKTESDPPAKETTVERTPIKPKTTTSAPPPQLIKPSVQGPYLVQTGSFEDPTNANKETERLKKLGFDAKIKTGNTANKGLIYRVRIGYFKSRAEAEAFIRQNRRKMPGAIPAHR